ncbi:MAG: PRC-barrel domain-containing protein [Nanoarchaeota archaeon]|nr:PRC-barrel domain-containing protein [Nanoarchaeota archaeon]
MSQRSISGRNLENAITSDDILGKDVVDVGGNFIGVVDKVLIDPKKLDLIGIEVDKGFLKKGLSIGKGYIKRVTDKVVFLNIKVAFEIKGMLVFDNLGAKIGSVSEVKLVGNRNKIGRLFVRQGIGKELIEIQAELIETIGHNVMLNVSKKELK